MGHDGRGGLTGRGQDTGALPALRSWKRLACVCDLMLVLGARHGEALQRLVPSCQENGCNKCPIPGNRMACFLHGCPLYFDAAQVPRSSVENRVLTLPFYVATHGC